MKLSIAWIFDHIDADWRDIDIADLVRQFNLSVAEIEGVNPVKISLDQLTLVQVRSGASDALTSQTAQTVEVYSQELGKTYELPARADAQMGHFFMVKKTKDGVVWARGIDVGSEKDYVLPAIDCGLELCDPRWKDSFEVQDYIIEVDNKSITNRPDMWSHRGFAREIAALLKLPLKPLDTFLVHKKTEEYGRIMPSRTDSSFQISVEDPERIKRFATLYIQEIKQRPSLLWMAHRLLRVDSKPIDVIVDVTNYVMLDIGQPMHAFDARKLADKHISARMARDGEKLTLLDGQEIALTDQDMIIASGKQPVALAGIMGGASTAVDKHTSSLLLDSANYSASTIRRTTTRIKKRTDASSRFEKTLDPNQNVFTFYRFLKLMDQAGVSYTCNEPVISLGAQVAPIEILVEHSFIEKRLGVEISAQQIIDILQRLEFGVKHQAGAFLITVPTFRSTKDVTIREDIIEEVGRYFGYMNIPKQLPSRGTQPLDMRDAMRVREIKQTMAFSLNLREVYNYALYDEAFLKQMQYDPGVTVAVQNPVSQNWERLIDSLVPGLMKNVATNQADYDQLRFFEWARTWRLEKDKIIEKYALGGIIYDRKHALDFYACKALLEQFFYVLRIPVTFERVDTPERPWYMPYQTAHIKYEDRVIGIMGMAYEPFTRHVIDGHAYIYELDGNFLLAYQQAPLRLHELSKYQEVARDVSMMIPAAVTVAELSQVIAQATPYITSVTLVDFFEKKEWNDQRSVTMRFVLNDPEKTFTKEEVDAMYHIVVERLQKLGATIR